MDVKIGVAQMNEDVFIPAIIGDINLPSTLEMSNLSIAKLVVNVTKNANSTYSILDFIDTDSFKGHVPNLVLSFYRTADKSYLITRGIDIGRYYIYPIQVSGITLGNKLYSFYRKSRSFCTDQSTFTPTDSIVIVGEGKQLFFAMESFWIRIKEDFQNNFDDIERFFKEKVSILTDSDFITKESSKNNMWRLTVPRSVRSPIRQDQTFLEIPIAAGSPMNLTDLRSATRKRPKIILVSFDDGKKAMDVLHELLIIADKDWLRKRDKPYIIVSAREKDKKYLKDVLFYWDERLDDSYPRQYPDGIVDFYEGSNGMLRGLVESAAITNRSANRFEISICLNSSAGATASILSAMSGLQAYKDNFERNIPSFMNFDIKVMNNNKWCFNSNSVLVPPSNAVISHENSLRALLINATDDNIDKLRQYFGGLEISKPVKLPKCPGRQVCSIHTYSRRYKSDQRRKQRNEEAYASEKRLIAMSPLLPKIEKHETLADIIVCGNGNKPGTFAEVLNHLLFRRTKSLEYKESVNFNYIQSFTCYDNRFTYHKILGEIVKHEKFTTNHLFLDACLIYPITCPEKWREYAMNLCGFLNQRDPIYNLYVDKERKDTRILLIKKRLVNFNESKFILDSKEQEATCCAVKGDCKLLDLFYNFSKIEWEKVV